MHTIEPVTQVGAADPSPEEGFGKQLSSLMTFMPIEVLFHSIQSNQLKDLFMFFFRHIMELLLGLDLFGVLLETPQRFLKKFFHIISCHDGLVRVDGLVTGALAVFVDGAFFVRATRAGLLLLLLLKGESG